MSDIFNVSSVVRHSASGPLQEQFIEINVPPLEETVSPLLMTMLTSSRGQMILLPQRPKMSFKATAMLPAASTTTTYLAWTLETLPYKSLTIWNDL